MKRLLALMLALSLLAGCTTEPSSAPEEPENSSSQSSSLPEEEPESSSESVSEPQSSTAQNSSAASQPAVTLAWWQQELSNEKLIATPDPVLGFAPCGTPEGSYWIYDDTRKVSWSGNGLFARSSDTAETAPVALILDSAVEAEDIGQPVMTDTFFEIVGKDDTKITGQLYEQGVELTRSLPGQGYGDSVKLKLNDADLTTLRNNLTQSEADSDERSAYRPAWLTMMRESRAESITYRASTGEENRFDASNPWEYYVFDQIAEQVTSAGTFTDKTSLPDSSQVTVTFNNGLVYAIYATETQLLVTTNDTDQGLLYTLRSGNSVYEKTAMGHLNPPTGKPVIYLYPEEVTDCTVTVDYSPFTYTYPTYNDGWEVTAYPDGRLINKADGTEHYYLFWRAAPVPSGTSRAALWSRAAIPSPSSGKNWPIWGSHPGSTMTSSPTGCRRCRTPPTTSSCSPRSSMRSWHPSLSLLSRTALCGCTWSTCRWTSPSRSPNRSSPPWSAPDLPLWNGAALTPAT